MALSSHIEWTDATWNPVTGCSKVSPGCKHCYAERMAHRLRAIGLQQYRNGFEVTLQPQALTQPLNWRRPRRVFVNSMSDLFHESIPTAFILSVFEVIAAAHWHVFQILTKRSDRLGELRSILPWPRNLWIGTSIESDDYLFRLSTLLHLPAAVRFLSLEPLLGPMVRLPLRGVDWVIVGGESGPGARPVEPNWVRMIRDRCVRSGVPFFFKQWGGVRKSRTGRALDGRTWDQFPEPKLRRTPRTSCRGARVSRQCCNSGSRGSS